LVADVRFNEAAIATAGPVGRIAAVGYNTILKLWQLLDGCVNAESITIGHVKLPICVHTILGPAQSSIVVNFVALARFVDTAPVPTPASFVFQANNQFSSQLVSVDAELDAVVFRLMSTPPVPSFTVEISSDGRVLLSPPMMWSGNTTFSYQVVQLSGVGVEMPEMTNSAQIQVAVLPATTDVAPLLGVVTPNGLVLDELKIYDSSFEDSIMFSDVVGLSFNGDPVTFDLRLDLKVEGLTNPDALHFTTAVLKARGCSVQDRSSCNYPWSHFDMAVGYPLVASAARVSNTNPIIMTEIVGGHTVSPAAVAQSLVIQTTRCAPFQYFTPPNPFISTKFQVDRCRPQLSCPAGLGYLQGDKPAGVAQACEPCQTGSTFQSQASSFQACQPGKKPHVLLPFCILTRLFAVEQCELGSIVPASPVDGTFCEDEGTCCFKDSCASGVAHGVCIGAARVQLDECRCST
jgi:hypothetical protein